MTRILSIVLFLISYVAVGCSPRPTQSNYDECIADGMTKLKWANEMNEMFPFCDHFVIHYGIGKGVEKEWQSEAYFGGRFVITMSVQIVLNDHLNGITKVEGSPKFYLREIISIVPDGGRFHAKIGKQDVLQEQEWLEMRNVGYHKFLSEKWGASKEVDYFEELAKSIRRQRGSN